MTQVGIQAYCILGSALRLGKCAQSSYLRSKCDWVHFSGFYTWDLLCGR